MIIYWLPQKYCWSSAWGHISGLPFLMLAFFPPRSPRSQKFAVCFKAFNSHLPTTISRPAIPKIYILSLTTFPDLYTVTRNLPDGSLPLKQPTSPLWNGLCSHCPTQVRHGQAIISPFFSSLASCLLGLSLWKVPCSLCHSALTLTVMAASWSSTSSHLSSHQSGNPQKMNPLRHFFTQHFSS